MWLFPEIVHLVEARFTWKSAITVGNPHTISKIPSSNTSSQNKISSSRSNFLPLRKVFVFTKQVDFTLKTFSQFFFINVE